MPISWDIRRFIRPSTDSIYRLIQSLIHITLIAMLVLPIRGGGLQAQATLPEVKQAHATLTCSSPTLDVSQQECEAVTALYVSAGGRNWFNQNNWLETDQVCGWHGVQCNENRQIVFILLNENNLAGTLPPLLGDLSNLVFLGLWGNQLSGSLPAELGQLSQLVVLDVNHNQFTGSIPPELGNLTKLTDLWLSDNQLTGELPVALGNANQLQSIHIESNRLTGTLPSTFTALTNLTELKYAYNGLKVTQNELGLFRDAEGISLLDDIQSQTVPPTNLQGEFEAVDRIKLAWTPILFQDQAGHYEISYGTAATGPFTVAGITENKSDATYILSNLQLDTTYYLRVRTYTAAHVEQPSELYSDYTQVISLGGTQPATTPEAEPEAVIADIQVTALEITQGLQNLANEMPLIEDRPTWARAYVRSTFYNVNDVDARLHGFRNGAELDDSPLSPEFGSITVPADGGLRTNLDDSFNFFVPPAWRTGNVTFEVEINPDGVIPETDLTNNRHTETVAFHPSRPLDLVFVPIKLHEDGDASKPAHIYHTDDEAFDAILANTYRYLPVVKINWREHPEVLEPDCGGRLCNVNTADQATILKQIEAIRLEEEGVQQFYQTESSAHWVGMVHHNFFYGGLAMRPLKPYWQNFSAYASLVGMLRETFLSVYELGGSKTMAHELSHNLGMMHVDCDRGEANTSQSYPYSAKDDAPCSLDAIDPAGFYAFDVYYKARDLDSPSVISNDPDAPSANRAFPMMSYQGPGWVSPYKYCQLLTKVGVDCSVYDYSDVNGVGQPESPIIDPQSNADATTESAVSADEQIDAETEWQRRNQAIKKDPASLTPDQLRAEAYLNRQQTLASDEAAVIGQSIRSVNPIQLFESNNSTKVIEDGPVDTFSIELLSAPTAPVNIALSGDGQLDISPSSLTFTIEQWEAPIVVTLSAVDNNYNEPDLRQSLITFSVESDDSLLKNLTLDPLQVTIMDNDRVFVQMMAEPTILDEVAYPDVAVSSIGSGQAGYISFTTNITSTRDLTIGLSYTGTATRSLDYTAPDSVLLQAGETYATSPVTAIDDAIVEHDESLNIKMESLTHGNRIGEQRGVYAVDISGNYAIMGTYNNTQQAQDAGAAHIFAKQADGNWQQVATLEAADGATDDRFGNSVAISDSVAIVGAYADDDNGSGSGSAYIFTQTDGEWLQTAKLTASDASASDHFGFSVDIDGGTALVGARKRKQGGLATGAAYIFTKTTSGEWVQRTILIAPDGYDNDNFGYSVSLQGTKALVGSYLHDAQEDNVGAAYLFEANGDWSNPVQVAKLMANDQNEDDYFGFSVDLQNNTALIGARGDDEQGNSAGAAYLFGADPENQWHQIAKVMPPSGSLYDNFGYAVALDDTHAAIGAYGDNDLGNYAGKVYLYTKGAGSGLQSLGHLTASDGGEYDYFGFDLALDGMDMVVSSFLDSNQSDQAGKAYFFADDTIANNNNGWYQINQFTASKASHDKRQSLTILSDDTTTISISGPQTINEEDNGVTTMSLAATLNAEVEGGFEVTYETQPNSATALENDFLYANQTILFDGNAAEEHPIAIQIQGDAVVESDEEFFVNLVVEPAFADLITLAPESVIPLQILNDDTPGLYLTPAELTITEGNSGSYSIQLASQPTANVIVNLSASNQASVSPATLTFGPSTWANPQTVTVQVLDDNISTISPTSQIISHTLFTQDSVYSSLALLPQTILVTDNDTAGISAVESGSQTAVVEGGSSDSYTIQLLTEPIAAVQISILTGGQVTAAPTDLTFSASNWNIPQTVIVSAVDDQSQENTPHAGQITHRIASNDAQYNGMAIRSIAVAVTDNDWATATALPTATPTAAATQIIAPTTTKTVTPAFTATSTPTPIPSATPTSTAKPTQMSTAIPTSVPPVAPTATSTPVTHIIVRGSLNLTEGFGEINDVEPANPANAETSIKLPEMLVQYQLVLLDSEGNVLTTYSFSGLLASIGDEFNDDTYFEQVIPVVPGYRSIEIRIPNVDTGETETIAREQAVESKPPTITILSPNEGLIPEETLVTWTASDPDNDALTYTVLFTSNDGETWHTLATGLTQRSYRLPPHNELPGGNRCRIKVMASDGFYKVWDQTDGLLVIPDNPPRIDLPENQEITEGERITLNPTIQDREDKDLEIVWRSETGEVIGTGIEISTNELSPGEHTLTVSATDSQGNTTVRAITIRVTVAASAPNRQPTTVNDVANTIINIPVAIRVLENDSDADGDALALLEAVADHGQTAFNGEIIYYIPALDFSGTDRITYTVADSQGATASGEVSVGVMAVQQLDLFLPLMMQ